MSTTERPVSTALKTMLVNNEPFQYAHLIKFERPSRPDEFGQVSTSKQRYTYLTDASIDVSFDDGSSSLNGTANGIQTYLANKVLNVGAIQEQTRATPSNTTVVLDGNGLGADITGAATISVVTAGAVWDITYAAPISLDDLLAEGFREGDKVTVKGTSNVGVSGNGITVNITAFRSGNALRVSKIDENLTAVTESTQLKLASEEIISILLNKNAVDYASFINREVFIYRAYFKDGVMVGQNTATKLGGATLLFKGIISGVAFEDSEGAIRVSWNLSSHWADFAQVKGRVTSDSAHRALDSNGAPQPNSALKPIYAYDKGFIHGETSVNMLTKYVVQVEKQDIKSKKGFLGIGAGVKVKKYLTPEDRFTNLDFQIQAKAIPIIYGVRKPETIIPVFADTLNANSNEVYVVAVISEGEIGGIYDVTINGNSLLCSDKADLDARGTQSTENTVELVCRGRADRGDALGGEKLVGTSYTYYGPSGEAISISVPDISNYLTEWRGYDYLGTNPITIQAPTGFGLVDGDSLRLGPPTSQQEITLDVFTGKPGQKASAQLAKLAYEKKFKIQNSYWLGSNTYEYWGPNHRLLDTAYIVGKFIIKDGETTIPEINVVVRGKLIDCYNYDYSYLHDTNVTGESADNFVLGQIVSLYYLNSQSQEVTLNANVQIIDKWTFYNPDGTTNVRFRFSGIPNLNYDSNGKPSVKKFYMRTGIAGNPTWTMNTFNYNKLGAEFSDTTNRVTLGGEIVSLLGTPSVAGTYVTFNYGAKADMTYPASATKSYQVVYKNGSVYDNISGSNTFPYAIMEGSSTPTSTALVTYYTSAAYGAEATALGTTTGQAGNLYIASKNTVKLPTSANSSDTYYVGDNIEITRYIAGTGKLITQSAVISSYDGANQVAAIDGIWDFIPVASDYVRIYPKYSDRRVSTNPAIQTLDYITSETYGKGLDYTNDLDLPSWTESARKCDTRSDVTVLTTAGTAAVGDVYKYPATGNILWQGTVSSISGSYIKFTNVIGKLTNKWNSWKSWKQNEVVYNSAGSLFIVNTAGVYANAQTTWDTTPTAAPSGMTSTLTPFVLTKVSGNAGSTNLSPTTLGNPIKALNADGQTISGYSIYDCDDVNYWRMSGWDEHAQRYVTRNQCNITIDTSLPLFDNINALLDHYNGILRYTAGKYYLDVEEIDSYEYFSTLPSSNNYIGRSILLTTNNRRYRYNESNAWELDIRTITVDDIIGKIQLSDEGTRSAFNSLTASFADPANKFEPRNVSFFNSDYLKTDRNVFKKGNLSVPGITNYYNTRLLADSFLNKSRFGLTISMTIRPSGFLLLAGTIIQVIYPRYDWTAPGKNFRVESVNYQPDGLVDIVAKEYDDSFYTLANIKRVAGTGATTVPTTSTPSGPTNLIVTSADTLDELLNGVELFWDNDPSINESSNAFTEVYASLSPHLYVTVTGINGGSVVINSAPYTDVLTTSSAHGLTPGMPIYPESNYAPSTTEINSEEIYYVLATPSATTFTLSSTKNGTTPVNLSTGTGLALKIRTATLIGTVPVPIRSYVDSVVNDGTQRVEKYYWVRHRINRV